LLGQPTSSTSFIKHGKIYISDVPLLVVTPIVGMDEGLVGYTPSLGGTKGGVGFVLTLSFSLALCQLRTLGPIYICSAVQLHALRRFILIQIYAHLSAKTHLSQGKEGCSCDDERQQVTLLREGLNLG
jgi:hypothetical protein